MSKFKTLFFVLLGVMLIYASVSAQKPTECKIIGKVLDPEGVGLPGVTVEATSPKLIGKATTISDTTGTYRLMALVPGAYTIQYTLPGFSVVVRKDIVLQLEQTLVLDITMTPGKIEEEITVIGKSPLIDVKSTARGFTLTKEVFQLLPKGRNFDALLTAVPGVSNEAQAMQGISVDGASSAENMYYIDGVNTSNLVDGRSGQDVNFDFVEEVQFKSSGYNAEFGGSMGGVVNVITRSGSNEYHGEILSYYWGNRTTGRERSTLYYDFDNYDTHEYYPYDDWIGKTTWYNLESGLNLGGYLIKDKIWFFGSFLPRLYKRTRTIDLGIQGIDWAKDFHRKETYWNFQAKLSAQPVKNLRLSAGFINNFYKYKGSDVASNSASRTVDYDTYGFHFPNYSASGSADMILGNNLVISARGGYFMTDQNTQEPPAMKGPRYRFVMEQPYSYAGSTNNLAIWPEIPAAYRHPKGWFNYPGAGLNQTLKVLRERYNANLDLSYYLNLAGEHSLKVGGQYIRQGEDISDGAVNPYVMFGWNDSFTAYGINYGRGKYGWYSVRNNKDAGPYGTIYTAYSNRWAFYVQDSWTIGEKLTLNAGVRTEAEYIPSCTDDPRYKDVKKPVNFPFDRKISPRFGFIYDVFGDSSLKVYGNFAIYQDVMKLYMAANALGGVKWKSAYYTLDDWDFTKIGVNNYYPGTLLNVLDFRAPVFDTIDPNMKPVTQREITLGADKRITENISLSVRGVWKSLLYTIEDCAVVDPDTGEYYFYTNPGSDFLWEKYKWAKSIGWLDPGAPRMPKAKREYLGLNIGLDKRLSNNWLFGFSYTLSRLSGNYSGLANSDEEGGLLGVGRVAPNGERSFDLWHFLFDKNLDPIDGLLPTDRPHFFKAYASYVFPWGLTIGTVFNAMSGTPVSESWNVEGPGYYPYGRANLGRTPFLWYADAYAEYNLKLGKYGLQFSINVSNLFNTDTAQRIDNQVYIDNISPGEAALLTKTWEPAADAAKDILYKMPFRFYDPFQARLGVKFIF
jgi:hypothetical protein